MLLYCMSDLLFIGSNFVSLLLYSNSLEKSDGDIKTSSSPFSRLPFLPIFNPSTLPIEIGRLFK